MQAVQGSIIVSEKEPVVDFARYDAMKQDRRVEDAIL